MSSVACFIPVKSRSTRVPGKNKRPLNGKMLFEYILDAVVASKAFDEIYVDGYSCMLDGYTKSFDKIVELGRDDVNKFNIYIKFGCNENIADKTTTSSKPIESEI